MMIDNDRTDDVEESPKNEEKATMVKGTDIDENEGNHQDDEYEPVRLLNVSGIGVPGVPDGGYGWVIVFASFMCNFTVDGIANSFGVFLPKYVSEFGVGTGSVAWAGSLLCGVYLFVGPIVSALTNKFGCRSVCIVGAIVAATALALSSLATSLVVLICTYGIIGGIGCGLIYLPSVVCVGYYFERRRALATGIAVCGSGVGTFVFAQISVALLSVMTWHKVNLVYAGVILLCAGYGMLMRPLVLQVQLEEDDDNEDADIPEITMIPSHEAKECGSGYFMVQLPDGTMERRLKVPLTPNEAGHATERVRVSRDLPNSTSITMHTSVHTGSNPRFGRSMSVFSYMGRTYSLKAVTQGSSSSHKTSHPSIPGSIKQNTLSPQSSTIKLSVSSQGQGQDDEYNSMLITHDELLSSVDTSESRHIIHPLARPDIFYAGSLSRLEEYESQRSLSTYTQGQSIVTGPPESAEVPEPQPTEIKPPPSPPLRSCLCCRCCRCCSSHSSSHHDDNSFRSTLVQMMDFSLLRNPVFVFIALSNVFGMLGFYVPLVYIVNAAIASGVESRKASYLLSIIGVTNTVGRVVSGMLSDLPKMNPLLLSNFCVLTAGIIICCVPFCEDYYAYIGVAICFGFFISAFVSLTSIILVQLLGLEKLTNAFGLLILFRGSASIVGAPLAGALYDAYGNYEVPFLTAGVFFIISSMIGCMVPFVRKFGQPKYVHKPEVCYRVGYLEEKTEADVVGDTQTQVLPP